MTFVRLLVPFIVLAIDIYAIVDIITIHEWRIKALNKFAWIVIILFLPLIGAIIWFVAGRESNAERDAATGRGSGGGSRRYDTPRTMGPDDDPVFLHNATRFEDQEKRIARLEAELKALDDEKD